VKGKSSFHKKKILVAEKSFRSFARVFTSVLCASLVSFNEREEDIFLHELSLLSFDFSLQKEENTGEKITLTTLFLEEEEAIYRTRVRVGIRLFFEKVFLQCRGVVAARLRRCSPRRRRRRRRRV